MESHSNNIEYTLNNGIYNIQEYRQKNDLIIRGRNKMTQQLATLTEEQRINNDEINIRQPYFSNIN